MDMTDKKLVNETREEKNKRISTAINSMEMGESISPTNLFKSIGIHPETGKYILDLYDSLKAIGFKTIRDKNKAIKLILRTDEELILKNDIRDIKRDILNILQTLDKLKQISEQRKKNG